MIIGSRGTWRKPCLRERLFLRHFYASEAVGDLMLPYCISIRSGGFYEAARGTGSWQAAWFFDDGVMLDVARYPPDFDAPFKPRIKHFNEPERVVLTPP